MFKFNDDIKNSLKESLENHDLDAFASAINDLAEERVNELALEKTSEIDRKILEGRGKHVLTSDENKFYEKVIEALKSSDPKQAISNIDAVLPETVLDRVFDDIEQNHPVLSKLDIQRVNAKVKLLFTSADSNEASWTATTAKITKEVSYGFEELDATILKLSAYIAVPNAYLDLGPAYIDQLTRTYLYEALSKGLEKGVITNKVSNTGPIGMLAKMDGGTTSSGVTTYTEKTAIAVTEFTPKGLAPVLKAMAKTRKGNPRPLNGLYLIVNPNDNITKIKPAICVQNASGDWVDRLPYKMDIIESQYVAEGTAIMGLDKMYALGVATDPKGTIEYSDEYQFLEETRTYKIKIYANGQPKDNNAFQKLNISNLKEAQLLVVNVNNTVNTGTQDS